MSTTADRLDTACFPEDYAAILIETLAITPANFLSIKDALYHFRHLGDDQAVEAMRHIAERIEPDARTVRIEVRGGVVQEVSNVPPGWSYEVVDHDDLDNETAGGRHDARHDQPRIPRHRPPDGGAATA